MIAGLSQPHVKKFILEHQDDDPATLLLSASKYPDVPLREVAAQIKARQKAKNKIPSWYQSENIIFPPALAMEQCSSEATARLKSEWLQGDKLIDLTGGAGIDTYFLSRRFNRTYYVEKETELGLLAKHNFARLQAPRIHVTIMDALDFLKGDSMPVDWIYIDPARRDDHHARVFRLSDCQPDVTLIQDSLFRRADNILIKTSPMLDIKQALKELRNVEKVYVVAVRNEVKEVLYAIQKGFEHTPHIHTINLKNYEDREIFSYPSDAESTATVIFDYPKGYLYEPNAAILKAGGFKIIGACFGLLKLHPHSHLYTSDRHLKDFPGRKFKIQAISRLNKKEVLAHIPEGKAHITARNFPYSVDMIRKKTGLTPGGDHYVFATTNMDHKLVLLICVKFPVD